jgi:hypothetical protein
MTLVYERARAIGRQFLTRLADPIPLHALILNIALGFGFAEKGPEKPF